jgi:predicted esterase YcpF (UPF0227 family)
MRQVCVYLHGFNSTPHSEKARCLKKRLHRSEIVFYAPDLLGEPMAVMARVKEALVAFDADQLLLVGSSLGGYYAAHLHDGIPTAKTVLINPALAPEKHREEMLGVHVNPYSGVTFEVTAAHYDQLASMSPRFARQEAVMLMLQTGDDIIDYRDALGRLPGAVRRVQVGGSHRFDNFSAMIDDVLRFGFGD